MFKRTLLSLTLISTISFSVFAFTQAFFSDTETSAGNTFAAGKVDLLIGNTSYYNGVYEADNSWPLDNLDSSMQFFYENDLKLEDWGEDTISIQANTNEYWLCAESILQKDDDVSCTEPESLDDISCDEPNQDYFDGDLGAQIEFKIWADDGDNVYETDETVVYEGSPDDEFGLWPLVDNETNFFGTNGPLSPGETYFLGKFWCFGDIIQETPITQDTLGAGQNNGPDQRGSGFECTGEFRNNAAQSDQIIADISFYAVQARNNPDFVCGGLGPDASPFASPISTPSPTLSPDPTPHDQFVDQVVLTNGGTFGAPVTLSSDPAVAQARTVGAPDNSFIQISDGTQIVWQFVDNQAVNGSGADIRIHVIDAISPGSAKIEVSPDGSTWTDAGNFPDTSDVEIELTSLSLASVSHVRITDLFDAGDDFPQLGFDLDAIEAINSVPLP